MVRNVFWILVLCVCCELAQAQVSITYPSERAVFQRNQQNRASIPIKGVGSATITRVEARLVPVVTGQGTLSNWLIVDRSPVGGSFTGFVEGEAGWYVLQVRTFDEKGIVQSSQVERVGIGEVFIVCGQSNAQGFRVGPLWNAKGASEDRVNAYGFQNDATIPEHPPLNDFRQLGRSTDIGPHGQGPWLWGEFGDEIVRKLNVPVLFFNAAFEGTLVNDYLRSAKGEVVTHTGFGFQFPSGAPYSFLGNVLKNHIPFMGLRAVIWVQGESDNGLNTSESEYYTQLKELIEFSRKDAGSEINWIVSRTSLLRNEIDENIINAQNRIIRDVNKVYAGPDTDIIQVPRPDGVHLANMPFGYQGLSAVAQSFWRQLDTFFFNSSSPTPSGKSVFVDVEVSCNGANQVSLSYPVTSSETVIWSGGRVGSTINVNSGKYEAIIVGSDGSVKYSKTIDVDKIYPSKVPKISSSTNRDVACQGETIQYQVEDDFLPIIWQNGSTETSFTTNEEIDIYAIYKNDFGCESNRSNVAKPKFVAKPEPPSIVPVDEVLAACEGESVRLQIQNSADLNVLWSTGERSKVISISTRGESVISATAASQIGCSSESSESVLVTVLDKPLAPVITQNGPYSLGVVFEEGVYNYHWYDQSTLIARGVESIKPPSNGIYRIEAAKEFVDYGISCPTEVSDFFEFTRVEKTGIEVYPNPVVEDLFYISSDETLGNVKVYLFDELGRMHIQQDLQMLDLPQAIGSKGSKLFGKYFLRIEYDGFYEVVPLLFE